MNSKMVSFISSTSPISKEKEAESTECNLTFDINNHRSVQQQAGDVMLILKNGTKRGHNISQRRGTKINYTA